MTENQSFRAALIQMRSGREVANNLQTVTSLVIEAAESGAQYIQTPENTLIMEFSRNRITSDEISADLNEAYKILRTLAGDLGIWLHIGASAVRRDDGMMANRSELIGPDGGTVAHYDKIHMFDAELGGSESYRESSTYHPGDRTVIVDLPWGRLGMTICYDLRFPLLYRALASDGSDFISVPSAFTHQTGEAHWHVLLRARAIETGCFILAAGQGGLHEIGRSTYGHSLIISPWGEVIGEAKGVETCVIIADINPDEVGLARKRIPSLHLERPFKS